MIEAFTKMLQQESENNFNYHKPYRRQEQVGK